MVDQGSGMQVYFKGEFVDEAAAKVSIFDRGFLFGDGVYEGIRYFSGKPVALAAHQERLARSMRMIGIEGFSVQELGPVGAELLAVNGLSDAGVYWQVTRGFEPTRSHAPQSEGAVSPTVLAFAWELPSFAELGGEVGCSRAILQPDLRWQCCEIKSTNLLPNTLATAAALRAGAAEAILSRGDFVSEGASSNVWVVLSAADRKLLLTPPLADDVVGGSGGGTILAGTMRGMLLEVAGEWMEEGTVGTGGGKVGFEVGVRPVTVAEIRAADEVMISSSMRLIRCITHLDGVAVGGHGGVGPVCAELQRRLFGRIAMDLGLGRRAGS